MSLLLLLVLVCAQLGNTPEAMLPMSPPKSGPVELSISSGKNTGRVDKNDVIIMSHKMMPILLI